MICGYMLCSSRVYRIAAKGAPDPSSVPRRRQDPTEAVQGPEGAHARTHGQVTAEGGSEETEGGTDEEDHDARRTVRE